MTTVAWLVAAGSFALGWMLSRMMSRSVPAADDDRATSEQIGAANAGPDDDGTAEPVGSVGMRLAYQLERILGADAIVVVAHRSGPQVIGASGRVDRRLLGVHALDGSPVANILHEAASPSITDLPPLGDVLPNRRRETRKAWMAALRDENQVIGGVVVWLEGDGLPDALVDEIAEVLGSAGPRLARAVAAEAEAGVTRNDPLTGLLSRSGLDELLARPGSRDGSLLVADVDRLSLLNETMGNVAGDAALIHIARIIREQIRGSDAAARIGGEEFAIWLPGANLPWGARIAERIRVKLGTTRWDWQGRSWPLSATFGVANCPETTRGREGLLAQAGAAMLEAKQAGRNRVQTAGMAGT